MAKKKPSEAAGDTLAPASSPGDTSFKLGDKVYDFNQKHFAVPGLGVVDVAKLVEDDAEQFDALCAKLVEIGSGFIHEITE